MKLSIITINYNHLEGLKRTADSVLAQTWTDFEWIIVDGCSNDGSKGYIEEMVNKLQMIEPNSVSIPWNAEQFSMLDFTAKGWTEEHGENWIDDDDSSPHSDRRRLLWCSEQDKGIYNAMNKGIVKASGEYCLFLNSGDWLESSGVLKDLFENDIDDDIICGKMQKMMNRGNVLMNTEVYKEKLNVFDVMKCSFPHQACFIRRRLFAMVGFYDESLKIVADWKFFVLAIIYKNSSFRFVDLLVANQEPGGISDDGRFIPERKIVLEELFPLRIREEILLAHSTRTIRKNIIFRLLYALMIRIANKLYRVYEI